jgi:6-phosphogluconolactonase
LTAPTVRVLPDPERLAAAAAEEFVRAALEATRERGRFAVAVSGGSTPLRLYHLLARRGHLTPPGSLPWGAIHWFWVDERCVPPEAELSNYGAWHEAIHGAPIPPANVHRIHGEHPDPPSAAQVYEDELRQFLSPPHSVLDLVLLGMGADGHTASLFPHSEALAENTRWVVAPVTYPPGPPRITLTLRALNEAARVLFLVSGEEKAGTVRLVLEEQRDIESLPAQGVAPARGECVWLVDRAAARELKMR